MLSKAQFSKMMQSGRFFGKLLGPLVKTELPLMKNSIKPLAKSVLILLGLAAAASAADVVIHQENLRFRKATLIISNDEMEDIIRIVKSLEDSGLSLKGANETIQNKVKEKKGGFLSMLFNQYFYFNIQFNIY